MTKEGMKGRLVSEWALTGIVMLAFLFGKAAHFSQVMLFVTAYCLWELYRSRHESRLHWPQVTDEAKKMGRAILLFYGALLLESAILLDGGGAEKAVRLARLALPFFMVIYIEGKYPGGRGFERSVLVSILVMAVTGLVMEPGDHPPRIQGIYTHPNVFGLQLALVIPLGIYYVWRWRQRVARILLAAGLGLALVCLFYTDSRSAMGGLVGGTFLAIVVMVWLRRRNLAAKARRCAVLALAGILIAGGGVLWEMQSHRAGMSEIGYERIYMWEASYHMWSDHKLFGVGLANWEDAYYSPEYHPEEARETTNRMPHNMPIYFFSTAGILGGTVFLFFLYYTYRVLWRHARNSDDDALSLALFTVYFVFCLVGLLDATYLQKPGALTYYAILGYGLMKEKNEERRS